MKCAPIVAILFVALATSACSPDNQTPHAEAAGDAAKPAAPDPVEPSNPTGAHLGVSPASFSLCEHSEGLIEADVTWDATASGSRWVQIFVESPTTERKLWASRPPVGQGRTGRWVRDGIRFTLVDSDAGTTLASASVAAVACEN